MEHSHVLSITQRSQLDISGKLFYTNPDETKFQ
ncbi:MAG: hypothetical protein HW389_96 [Bacteroidetes bacterium]|nr:hypothetical protein [Bacteroidota bacterium]